MNGKIIALTAAIALCTALSGCKSNQSEPITETSAATSVSEISETSETTETTSVTTITTTAEISDTTVSETSETVKRNTVPEIELSDLKAVYGEKLYSTPECKIIDDFIYKNEEDFPAPDHIALARKAVFADEQCMDSINRYNDEMAEFADEFDESVLVETEKDLPFEMGASYDFDGDGENESVVSLDLSPAPTCFWGDGAIFYIDGENIFCVSHGDGSTHFSVRALDFGVKTFIEIDTYAGATTEVSKIYCTDNGTLEPVVESGATSWIDYRDGVFYYIIKYDNFMAYPIVFCEDGKFRQLGIKEITEEDFSAHLENGREYLDYLKSEKNVTGIYTMGYYSYQIDTDDGVIVFLINTDGNAAEILLYYGIYDRELTEELDYDIDISKLDVTPYSE
ncbi:MAG: hypothetical protein K2K44_12955 [Oscillospiraceae bacterium]|nr:hypothetical protein [Oscillospiraceae bacterium]